MNIGVCMFRSYLCRKWNCFVSESVHEETLITNNKNEKKQKKTQKPIKKDRRKRQNGYL
jgi:hypothetical protein